jgi:uncharacterized protein
MKKEIDLVVSPEQAHSESALRKILSSQLGLDSKNLCYRITRRSIDARQRAVKFNLKVEVYSDLAEMPPRITEREFSPLKDSKTVIVIGAGPAGLFAALKLIECGIKPIVLERGKDVQLRRRDIAAITKEHLINEDSNYCFGEGGAGTYSDGKLYTRSTKRGDVRSVLETLVQFGASEDILTDAHPHIGTNKLPGIIAAMRQQIIASGGEVRFNCRMTDFDISGNEIVAVTTQSGEKIKGNAVVLATGHSAQDIFELLHSKKVLIEFKPYAIGVRAEHPQNLIDQIQYKCAERGEFLPPASYNLVHQGKYKSVYSFCMCPGGIIAPCATSPGEVVTNGWSPSKRNNPWANSGIIVPVEWDDIKEFHAFGSLAGLMFQKKIEQACQQIAGGRQTAPAQRMVDFVNGKKSSDLPVCSYLPGVESIQLNQVLPEFIHETLKEGFVGFGKKMREYYTNEAILVAPESRTSSPVRIPRDNVSLNHPQLINLFPCGEGAGYAGGIVSAAIDGEKVAVSIMEVLHQS